MTPRAAPLHRLVARPIAITALCVAWGVATLLSFTTLPLFGRFALFIFGLAIIGWTLTRISNTYIAVASLILLAAARGPDAEKALESLGSPLIWLLFAAFLIAAGVETCGLSQRLAAAITARARRVDHLFYLLATALLITAFIIPSTSGRAAMMLPVFLALGKAIDNRPIIRALALLFPSIIVLSSPASLIGAGAHLIALDILAQFGAERITYGRWMMLGLPFAAVSCYASTWLILHLFLDGRERGQLVAELASAAGRGAAPSPAAPLSGRERRVLVLVLLLVLFWSTETLHGIDATLVALMGALLVTAPRWGALAFKDAIKRVDWGLLLFMAGTLEVSSALVDSGAAAFIVKSLFSAVAAPSAASPIVAVGMVAALALLAHLVITSRSARAAVLIPLVIVFALSSGYSPTALTFLVVVGTGFCLTLPVSAKPVAMFAELDTPTYSPRDLLRLSGYLIPLHLVLLLLFSIAIWPRMGLSLMPEQAVAQKQTTSAPRLAAATTSSRFGVAHAYPRLPAKGPTP